LSSVSQCEGYQQKNTRGLLLHHHHVRAHGRSWLPERCPHFRRPVPTGSGAVAGGLLGTLIGTLIALGLGAVAGGLLGALYGNAVEDAGLRSDLEKEIDKCRAQRKTVYIEYVPTASLA